MMILGILLGSIFYFAAGCPEVTIPPCSCRLIGYSSSTVTCTGAENELDLIQSLFYIKNSSVPVRTVEIFDATLNFLPSQLFKGMRFQKLFIAGSSMVSLTDSDEAFVGLEDSLEILLLNECTLFNGWRWSHLRNLTSLKELRSTKAGPLEINEDVEEIAHLSITDLTFAQDSISFVYDTAFATFGNLRMLSLKMNFIKELKRSMFPNPATKLQLLILSHNELQHLPEDLFTEMPSLQSILLADNEIFTVDEQVFLPVWTQLKKIDLTDNPLRCDCRMKWLLKERFPLNTWAKCKEPAKLEGTALYDLAFAQLWC